MAAPTTIEKTDERFVIDYGHPDFPARMVTFDELHDTLSGDIQARHYGYADTDDMAVYRYVPGRPPQLEPLTLTCVQRSEFDEDDWAYPVWELTGPDGTAWARMRIRIDGRV